MFVYGLPFGFRSRGHTQSRKCRASFSGLSRQPAQQLAELLANRGAGTLARTGGHWPFHGV